MHPHPTISPCQPPATNADCAMAVMPSAGCVVDTLHAQLPVRSQCYALGLQLTLPCGYWYRVHPACNLGEILHGLRGHRAQRGAA